MEICPLAFRSPRVCAATTVKMALLAVTLLWSTAWAACTTEFTSGAGSSDLKTSHAQSFTACVTSVVTSIEIQYEGSAVAGLTLKLFNGKTVSGAPAASQTGVSLGGGAGFKTITLAVPFPVTSGQQYTFDINVASPVKFGSRSGLESAFFRGVSFPTAAINHRVNYAIQTITGFAPASPVVLGSPPATLSATGGASGSPVVFATTSASTICTVSGTTVTFVGVGVCNLTANQAAGGIYPAAQEVTASITINAAPTPQSIPTLSEWGLIILSSLLALGTLVVMRRRQI